MAAFYFFVDPRLESATDPSNLNASDVMLLLVNNVVWWEPNHGVMECRVGRPPALMGEAWCPEGL